MFSSLSEFLLISSHLHCALTEFVLRPLFLYELFLLTLISLCQVFFLALQLVLFLLCERVHGSISLSSSFITGFADLFVLFIEVADFFLPPPFNALYLTGLRDSPLLRFYLREVVLITRDDVSLSHGPFCLLMHFVELPPGSHGCSIFFFKGERWR